MEILNTIIDYMNNARITSAVYPSSPYTGKLPKGVVKKGSKGSDVKAVQSFLNWCIKAGLSKDGVCGPKTVAAIKRYQGQYGLKKDGVFGAKSKTRAKTIIAKYAPKPTPKPTPAPTPKPTKTKQQKAVDYAKALAADNSWHYVVWKSGNKKTQNCPICNHYPKGAYHGFNCIRFTFACWFHGGGIPCKCGGPLIDNGRGNKMLKAKTTAEALKIAQNAIGCKDIKVIRNKNGIPQSQMQPGDACLYFVGSTYKHMFLYAGDGKMVDCQNLNGDANDIKVRKALSCKILVRYIGK